MRKTIQFLPEEIYTKAKEYYEQGNYTETVKYLKKQLIKVMQRLKII